MRVVVRIGVTFDADGYEDAGQILDAIDRKIGKVLDGKGQHDITSFETQPCKAIQFDRAVHGMATAVMTAEEPASRARERDRDPER